MTLLLQILLALTLSAHADAITDLCKHDIRQQTKTRAQLKTAKMSSQELEAAMDGAIPSAEYVVQADTAVCIADKMKMALDKPTNFDNYCFMSNARTRVDCFQAWQKKQDISYAKQVVQLAQTAYELAKKDGATTGADLGKISTTAIDIWVTSLERYSVSKNVAFKAAGGQERERLKKAERNDYVRAYGSVLKLAEDEYRTVFNMIKAIKNPKLESAASKEMNSLRDRIAKLKQSKPVVTK